MSERSAAGAGATDAVSIVVSGFALLVIPVCHISMGSAKGTERNLQPRASAKAVNRPKEKVCDGIAPSRPCRTSSSVLQAVVVVAFEPCQFAGLPWSTTIDDTVPFLARDMRSNIDSKSILNSPNPGPAYRYLSKRDDPGALRDVPLSIFFFNRSKHARASSSGSCPPSPRFWISRPHHFFVNHANPGFSGLPRGWWYAIAVSMQRGWQILSAFRSDSSECPRRTGVGLTENRARRWDCTSSNVVVTSRRASSVMPDHLQRVRLLLAGTRR